jgi:cysteine desulfurase/selenocysteine lyase
MSELPAPAFGDRTLFPTLRTPVYANHAGIAVPSARVLAAASAVHEDYATRGFEAFPTWLAQRRRLKEKLARLVGAAPDAIALTPNTTRGLVNLALCIPWARGDRVLLFRCEFPANVTPWQRAAELFGLDVVFEDADTFRTDPEAAFASLARALTRGVRLVAVSAVEFQTGFRMPVSAIAAECHRRGAQLAVDAVQACGVVPIHMAADGIDYLSCGSHKWLMSLEGCGFVACAPEHAAALRPNVAGWLGHEDGLKFLFEGAGHLRVDRPIRKTIDFMEDGNSNTAGFAALEAAVDTLHELGVPAIHVHVNRWNDAVEAALLERGFTSVRATDTAGRSGSLCVLPPAGVDVVGLHRALVKRGLACAVPDGYLRLSPHWPNALSEVDTVVGIIDESLVALS